MPVDSPILKAKFFPPRATSDFVERKSINPKLEKLDEVPILLVSAPSGYGKSTLVSAFLQGNRCPDMKPAGI